MASLYIHVVAHTHDRFLYYFYFRVYRQRHYKADMRAMLVLSSLLVSVKPVNLSRREVLGNFTRLSDQSRSAFFTALWKRLGLRSGGGLCMS